MSDSTDLTEQIEETAQGPAAVTTDGLSVQAQPLPDLVEADRYLATKAAAGSRGRGLRITKLVPPGAA